MERIDDLQFENLKIIQDTDGFCFGIDSVLLTEFARDIKDIDRREMLETRALKVA